jgi:hypothetical protein
MLYNCFRCPAQGLLTSQTLFDLGLDNYGLISGVTSANKELLKNSQTNFVRTSANSKQITIPTVDINSLTVPKLLYVSERTGIKLDNNLISKFKLITDLEQFIDHNKITTKFNKNIVNTLTENYVGFLSNDSNFITFRNITEEKCLGRYFDLKLTDDIIIHSRKFFNITTSINLLEPKLNIILGEGAFDILGIYNYLNRPDNGVFIGCAGKNYNSAINYFIREGFLNLDISIYSDSDVNKEKIQEIINQNRLIKSCNYSLKVFHNTTEDDFGHIKEKISPKRII